MSGPDHSPAQPAGAPQAGAPVAATQAAGSGRRVLGIGEVLGQLRAEFPDVTISKIRFLEAAGLVEPERTPAGYRKFSADDVARLRYVLAAQRDRYLPLRVIKSQLDRLDAATIAPGGAAPGQADDSRYPQGDGTSAAAAARAPDGDVGSGNVGSGDVGSGNVGSGDVGSGDDRSPVPADFAPDATEVRLSREQLSRASGANPELLNALEQYGLLPVQRGAGQYDGNALIITRTAAELARFGFEPRHLRAVKAAADREVGLMLQAAAPLSRRRGAEARARAEQSIREMAALSVRLHTALVRAGLSARESGHP